MVETCGRGIPLILKFAPDEGFREIGNMFIVSFPRPSFGELKLDQLVMKINFCKRALVVSGKAEKSKSMALYTP
ncbi:hypothetical protein [Desulfosarcina variabilis]|uniref:hypothetical protein n=1 Tax=Desulfosarcina variabilis TaxID=2300 RepID=UPI003AFAB16C